MTNFNSLTNEILQRIVNLCHAGDRAYAARQAPIPTVVLRKSKAVGKMKRKVVSQEHLNYGEWWGRSCSAISMVNKKLRSTAIKYLFTASCHFALPFSLELIALAFYRRSVFRNTKMTSFNYSILGSPAGNCIETVIFDHAARNEETSLFAFVCRTLPLLPNLRTIKGFKSEFGRLLCLNLTPSHITQSIKNKRALDALTRVATQINTWDITLELNLAKLFLSKNYNGIESLTVQSPFKFGFPILESIGTGFPSLLSPCSNLRDLTIRHTHRRDDQIVEPAATSVLSTYFSFANSLRSLTLDLERKNGRTTANDFEFIALFPFLESLNLTIRSTNLDEIESKSFLLPKLTSLEIVDCPFLHMHILIHCLDLPSISSIHFMQVSVNSSDLTPEEEVDEIRKLVSELGAYSATLRTLGFTFPGASRKAREELSAVGSDAVLLIDSVFVSLANDISARAQLTSEGVFDSDDDDTDYSDDVEAIGTSGSGRLTRSQGVKKEEDLGSTEELLQWAYDRLKRCRGVDEAGAEELRRVFEPVKDLREWLED